MTTNEFLASLFVLAGLIVFGFAIYNLGFERGRKKGHAESSDFFEAARKIPLPQGGVEFVNDLAELNAMMGLLPTAPQGNYLVTEKYLTQVAAGSANFSQELSDAAWALLEEYHPTVELTIDKTHEGLHIYWNTED